MPPKANNPESLYVHIPFCLRMCPYCDFPKVYYKQEWAEAYLSALFVEFKSRPQGPFSTIYIGGGTPTALPLDLLERLLSFLSPLLREGGEFSIEANPETVNESLVALLKKRGINRVSLGAQSSVPALLQTLGRKHTFDQVRKAVELLQNAGIPNINLDWMYGLPGETKEEVQEDIASFLCLKVPHISAYSLILEEGTEYAVKGIRPLDDDTQQDQFDLIRQALEKEGYTRYEISNFALQGHKCRHNLAYWNDLPYAAIGLGAAGSYEGKRYKNTRSLGKYLKGDFVGEKENPSKEDALNYYFLTHLRLSEGFALEDFRDRFEMDFLYAYKEAFEKLEGRGLLRKENGRVFPTQRGMDLLDSVLLELM